MFVLPLSLFAGVCVCALALSFIQTSRKTRISSARVLLFPPMLYLATHQPKQLANFNGANTQTLQRG